VVKATRHAGFTLIELMITVSLIGVLAAIATPGFIRSRTTAQANACINNLRQIDSAVQQWAMDLKMNGDSPVQFTDISSYLKSSIVCPAGGSNFADSYSISTVDVPPACQKLPADHLLPSTIWHTNHGHGKGPHQ